MHEGQWQNLDVHGNIGGILQSYYLVLQENLKLEKCLKIPLIRTGLFILTEEPFVLVRGNRICWEELTTEGQVSCAVTLACTFF